MSKRTRVLLGGILLTLMSVYLAIYVYSTFLPRQGSSDGFSATWDGRGDPQITNVDVNSPSSGLLQSGDELVAINGIKIRDEPGVLLNSNYPPGTRLTLTVRRAGELRDATITTVPYATGVRFDPIHYISILFLVTGWAVFLLRPEDKQAWLLAIMLATLVGLVGNSPGNLPWWLAVAAGLGAVAAMIFFPVFAHFFLVFPEPSPLLRRWRRLETWLYLPFFLLILPVFGPARLAPVLLGWLLKIGWNRFDFVVQLVVIAYLVAGLISLVINYRVADLIARRRLRVVMAGSIAGFLNLLLLILGGLTGLQEQLSAVWAWFEKAIYVTLPLVPLSFVYAIVRHKVIPVSLIIRRGVRYLLVSRGSIVLHLGLAAAVIFFIMDAFFTQMPSISGRTIGVISAVVGIVVWNLNHWFHRRVLAPAIDRRFFRQSYNAQQILADLSQSLRTVTDLPQLLELVATKIQSALPTENVTIFLREEAGGGYQSVYSQDYQHADQSKTTGERSWGFSADAEVVKELAISGQPVEVEAAEESSLSENSSQGESGLPESERKTLRELKSALLLPLATKGEVLGFISVGSRLGDLPFSNSDKHLLMSVAGPATFAIENARLVQRMVEEARRREEIEAENEQRAKEMEEARQLQLSMLPKTIPQLPHLEVAAYMKTATEVGGDYYDFNLADNGELTVVVGDATGHGLKAGTVVTAAKSLFNHLAETPDVTEFFSHSSRALKRMNLRSLFMAMTVARFNGHRVTLSSAGMPPALIYRANTGEIEEIPLTGVPLGSMTGYRYQQQQVLINRGDVVVLMSDGFPERFNPEGEMLDYGRAKDSLGEVASRSSQEIIQHFVGVGEAWADGKQQEDDVTFVVLKVK